MLSMHSGNIIEQLINKSSRRSLPKRRVTRIIDHWLMLVAIWPLRCKHDYKAMALFTLSLLACLFSNCLRLPEDIIVA
jgi:hypothetical protein